MTPENFNLLATIVKQHSGLVLTSQKAYFLESRLLPLVRKYNLKSLDDMADTIRSRRDEAMSYAITEAMATKESFFFRDWKPFVQFQKVLLPQLLVSRAAKKQIRIWSAGTSSGQKAYSLAMLCAEESAKLQDWKIDIIGTDLSKEMIECAKSGIYSQLEVQRGIRITMLVKYFHLIAGDKWQINDSLRQMVQFREGNLLQDFGPVGVFDLIYCRNVLPYFDVPTQTHVLEAMSKVLAPDGALVLGNTETTLGITDIFMASDSEPGLYVLAPSRS